MDIAQIHRAHQIYDEALKDEDYQKLQKKLHQDLDVLLEHYDELSPACQKALNDYACTFSRACRYLVLLACR